MIKIIEGKYKRKIIFTPKSNKTKPTSSRMRKSIFDTLSHAKNIKENIFHTNVLDVYAGSGSMGIECLSRGAIHCNFIDNSYESLKIIKKNLLSVSELQNSLISKFDASNPPIANIQYGLVFFDPPYEEYNFAEIINTWKKNKWFEKDTICIYEKHIKTKLSLSNNFQVIKNIKHANTEVLIIQT